MKSFLFLTLLISSIGFNSKNNSIIQYANPSESEIVNPDNIKYLHLNSQKDFDNIEQFTNVTHVKVSKNVLSNVPNQAEICLMGTIRHADFSSNELNALPDFVACLSKLEEIVLDHNRIEDFNELGYLQNLKRIDLADNNLYEVPKDITKILSLSEINLDDNQIEKLNSLSKHKLSGLSVARNQLKGLPKSFTAWETLKKLDLSSNSISELSDFHLEESKNLQELNLSGNKFEKMPDEIFSLRSLENLDLSKNQLELVDERFKVFNKLKQLDLSENYLSDFQGLPFLVSLERLNMTHTPIRQIPYEVQDLKELTELNVSRCVLKSISALKQHRKLRSLDLSENKLEEFPDNLELMALQHLNINENKLGSIHGIVTSCPNLTSFTASVESDSSLNEIEELRNLEVLDLKCDINGALPIGVGKLSRLKKLNMTGCNIFDIGILSKNTQLETLDLSNNKIVQIPASLYNLKRLVRLDISNNHDIVSYAGIKGMTELRELNLSYCSLNGIPEEVYHLENIEVLILKGNNISEEEVNLFKQRFPAKEIRL